MTNNSEIVAIANAAEATAKVADTFLRGCGIGINALFKLDEKEIKRRSKAVSEAIVMQAEAQAKAKIIKFETEDLIHQKLIWNELRRKTNLLKLAQYTVEDIKNSSDPISDIPVGQDWAHRFFNIAQDISNEDMLLLWGKILSGEIRKPNSFSLRTLEVLKNLSSEEAKFFQDAISLSFYNQFIILLGNINQLKDYNLPYDKILILRDAGLLSTGDNDRYYSEEWAEEIVENLPTSSGKLKIKKTKGTHFEVGVLNLTIAGTELASLIKIETNKKYLEDVKEMIKKKGMEVL